MIFNNKLINLCIIKKKSKIFYIRILVIIGVKQAEYHKKKTIKKIFKSFLKIIQIRI